MTDKEKDLWDSKMKTRFRTTKKWKVFRNKIIEKFDSKCQLCNTKYYGKRKKMLNIHHIYGDEEYDNLDEKRVCVLCSSCHDLVEKILIKIKNHSMDMKLEKSWIQIFLKHKIFTKELLNKIKKENQNV